jgi:hypothetical protein
MNIIAKTRNQFSAISGPAYTRVTVEWFEDSPKVLSSDHEPERWPVNKVFSLIDFVLLFFFWSPRSPSPSLLFISRPHMQQQPQQ